MLAYGVSDPSSTRMAWYGVSDPYSTRMNVARPVEAVDGTLIPLPPVPPRAQPFPPGWLETAPWGLYGCSHSSGKISSRAGDKMCCSQVADFKSVSGA